MKTNILKELKEQSENDLTVEVSLDLMEVILDKFGLYAIELIGENEPEKIRGLFGEMVDVPENVIRNEHRKFLREKLRKELFK